MYKKDADKKYYVSSKQRQLVLLGEVNQDNTHKW